MEHLSNEEKARRLCCSGCNNYVCYTNKRQCPTLEDLLRMAQWKDEKIAFALSFLKPRLSANEYAIVCDRLNFKE